MSDETGAHADRPVVPNTETAREICGQLLLAVGLVFKCDEPKGHPGDHLCPEGVAWNDEVIPHPAARGETT